MRASQAATIFAVFGLGVFPAMAQQFGAGSVGVGNDKNTKWVSICPPGTTIVSGSCFVPDGTTAALRSFGTDPDHNSWECQWTKSVPKANVRAFCSKTQ